MVNAPVMPGLTYQEGASSSAADAEGTSSKVCQAGLKKYVKIPNIISHFFKILVPGLGGWPKVVQGGESRLEPGVSF